MPPESEKGQVANRERRNRIRDRARDRAVVKFNDDEMAIDPVAAIRARVDGIIDAGLTLHERLWFSEGKEREKLRKYIKENPEEFAAKRQSFAMFFGKVLPNRVEIKDTSDKKRVSADDLEKLGLKIDQIKKIAFGQPQDSESEAEIVEAKLSSDE